LKAPALLIVIILIAATEADVILTQSTTQILPSLILVLELMSATVIPGIQSRLQLLKAMQMPFNQTMVFLDLLHKLMLFFETLVENPTLGLLACMYQDPDNENQPIH
jgi:hypothetical protein